MPRYSLRTLLLVCLLCLSLAVTGHILWSFVFYAWLTATPNVDLTAAQYAAYRSLGVALLSFALAVFSAMQLWK
jgi:hypothetical protein